MIPCVEKLQVTWLAAALPSSNTYSVYLAGVPKTASCDEGVNT